MISELCRISQNVNEVVVCNNQFQYFEQQTAYICWCWVYEPVNTRRIGGTPLTDSVSDGDTVNDTPMSMKLSSSILFYKKKPN